MSASRCFLLGVLVLTLGLVGSVTAQQQDRSPEQLWADFNHYVLIARPELARSAGERLLGQVDDVDLVEIVEESEYENYQRTLDQASRRDELAQVARELEDRLQAGRIALSRDEERIQQDIQLLNEGRRAFRNAVERLRAAGQFSAPHLLATLEDENERQLHPYVVRAMTLVGRPIVEPLAVALPELEASVQADVARVLGEVGYPYPVPYMRQVIEDEGTDPDARRVVEQAYNRLVAASEPTAGLGAAELFLALGRSQYRAGSEGRALLTYDEAEGQGIVWRYSRRAGLVPVPVPGVVHADILARDSAERALSLDAGMDEALSLYLMANLRRENRLPEGASDPTYNAPHPPAFYAMMAGPARLHDVLDQALNDGDGTLALDAIEALASTAGTDALVREDARRPMQRALTYTDPWVRFQAAEAMANARPQEEFPGVYRVVPILADAIRPEGARYAVVVADNQGLRNELSGMVEDLGYEAVSGSVLEDVRNQVADRPGIDLIVVGPNLDALHRLHARTQDDPRLSGTPTVAVIGVNEQSAFQQRFDGQAVTPVVLEDGLDAARSVVQQATEMQAMEDLSDQEQTEMALTALSRLYDIAVGRSVYNIEEAVPALRQALADDREAVVLGSSDVLALIDHPDAQRALAERALEGSGEVQLALLENLAQSARHYGSLLEPQHGDELLQLVQTSDGETAIAAARAHGALSLPTSNAVQMIAAGQQPGGETGE